MSVQEIMIYFTNIEQATKKIFFIQWSGSCLLTCCFRALLKDGQHLFVSGSIENSTQNIAVYQQPLVVPGGLTIPGTTGRAHHPSVGHIYIQVWSIGNKTIVRGNFRRTQLTGSHYFTILYLNTMITQVKRLEHSLLDNRITRVKRVVFVSKSRHMPRTFLADLIYVIFLYQMISS